LAKLLKIPKHLIVRVECWAYVVFVHRQDKGGQFISIGNYNNGKMPLLAKFRIARLGNNCGNCG